MFEACLFQYPPNRAIHQVVDVGSIVQGGLGRDWGRDWRVQPVVTMVVLFRALGIWRFERRGRALHRNARGRHGHGGCAGLRGCNAKIWMSSFMSLLIESGQSWSRDIKALCLRLETVCLLVKLSL